MKYILITTVFAVSFAVVLVVGQSRAAQSAPGSAAMPTEAKNPPVTITQDDVAYTLSNGIITAKVLKEADGNLGSLT